MNEKVKVEIMLPALPVCMEYTGEFRPPQESECFLNKFGKTQIANDDLFDPRPIICRVDPSFTQLAQNIGWLWPEWLHPDFNKIQFLTKGACRVYDKNAMINHIFPAGTIELFIGWDKYPNDERILYRSDFI